jgi:mono/diheme cytochrome c family protein
VRLARVNPRTQQREALWDLNPHLTYDRPTVRPSERHKSIGDPRGIAWNAAGTRAYVAGMGSNNVVVMSEQGDRVTQFQVGEGPTGVVVDDLRGRLYVLNRFAASVSVVSLQTHQEQARVPFFDPTPGVIKQGRKHLYGTHESSGLGHISCGSCHVDGRMDKLAWDLGDPSGKMDPMEGKNVDMGLDLPGDVGPVHPMKGPMVTQTLQDIIGKEVLHWRGDRDSLEAFNPAFKSLQGAEDGLTQTEMNEFKAFLATLTFPPNPFRNVDNSLSTKVPLPGRFAPNGRPLPDGDAAQGLDIFRRRNVGPKEPFISCATCHTLPTGMGASVTWNFSLNKYDTIAPGPNGENHAPVTASDFTAAGVLKIPQLRNLYEKEGMSLTQQESLSGFGFRHNGAVDSLTHFLDLPSFPAMSAQELANLQAFLLSFSGSDLPQGSLDDIFEPLGPASQDTHAAVGQQITLSSASLSKDESGKVELFLRLADSGKVGLVVKGRQGGIARGYTYMGHGEFQSDRASQQVSASLLKVMAGPGNELTWTVVAKGTERRIGIDRDEDGTYDRDEVEAGACEDEAALDQLSCR